MQRLFFNDNARNSDCRHSTLSECTRQRCWYYTDLTCACLEALHGKNSHSECKGEYLIGYSAGTNKDGKNPGAAIYMDCNCLCHKDKYYSPLRGCWM